MRPLMVLGCTSSAGKSLVVTGLVRWFARQGVDVVPFKAQNMSNNARVVAGGEIGVAQWLQAVAAGVAPDVRMNPVLLKPEADQRSQVVVNGVARPDLTMMPWRDRGESLWPAMAAALDGLRAEHELVVIEGAGSPAEINLPDLANNRTLAHAEGRALLVTDIDRGGAFAHLFGTWSLVPEETQRRLRGFVLNKFRGDASLLEPGPSDLAQLTGVPVAGVLPMLQHELPDEEGITLRAVPPEDAPVVAVIRYPYASNLDELHLLGHVARVRFATRPIDIDGTDVVILPGSKHVAADVSWMRDQGLADAVHRTAAAGSRVLGVCGGAMMLGHNIDDPGVVEGTGHGLGLLPLDTVMVPAKITNAVTVRFARLPPPWSALDGTTVDGYEIRHGRVHPVGTPAATDGAHWWCDGSILATTVHGLLESPDLLHALFGRRPPRVLERTFELLADAIDEHLDTKLLRTLTCPT